MNNLDNMCIFEGRVASDPNYSSFNGSNGPVEKALFRIAVNRALTSDQRQKVKNGDQSIKTADFIPLSLIGAQVATLRQYFPKGTPIKVYARYTEYKSKDPNTGADTYGHIFEVENIGFTIANNGGGNNNNASQNNQGQQQYQQPQQQYNQGQQQYNQGQQRQPQPAPQAQPQSNFAMFDENEHPF